MDYKNTLNLPPHGVSDAGRPGAARTATPRPLGGGGITEDPAGACRGAPVCAPRWSALCQRRRPRGHGAEQGARRSGDPPRVAARSAGTVCARLGLPRVADRIEGDAGTPGGRTWDADAAAIRSECDAYARKFVDLQRGQFKRLGIFGDWDNPYSTLDRQYEADELRLLADLVERFVYRGKKPVYWSIPFKTALAEAEVEYADHVSQSVYVKFRLKGEPNTFVLIWTTTPWTLPPISRWRSIRLPLFPRYRRGRRLHRRQSASVGGFREAGLESYQIVRTLHAEELATLEYEHPFCARTGRLYPAGFVTSDTGTGFVHIAPGHGADDYQLGLQVGLPILSGR